MDSTQWIAENLAPAAGMAAVFLAAVIFHLGRLLGAARASGISSLLSELKLEKHKLSAVFTGSREGIVLLDSQWRILLMNPAACQFLGRGDGPSTAPLTLPQAITGFTCRPPLEELLARQGRSDALELRRIGSKPLLLAGTLDRVQSDTRLGGYLLVFRDATAEKREEVLARGVLAMISHKIKTPLTVSLGYQQLLLKDAAGLNPFQRKALSAMAAQQERLGRLIDKLLFFASIQNPDTFVLRKAPCRLKTVVEETLASLKDILRSRPSRVSWNPALFDLLPPIPADPGLLREALRHLIENAVKFNPRERLIEIAAILHGSCLELSVKDNGPGIPPEERGRLFSEFHQIEESFTGQTEGLGLGLAFVKRVAEAHAGHAGVRTAPGRGSEFYLTLPLTARPSNLTALTA